MTTLKKDKAIGTDGLPDYVLKQNNRQEMLTEKLKTVFESWLNGHEIPKYVKTTRIVALSKEENNPYPEVGKIRTIAVSSAVTKLYEKIILQKLQPEITRCNLISEKQRAYK